MDRQETMGVFLSVVEEGDFSAAARRLRMTPSAVSKIIGRLESRLGVRLLQRSTRRISLTAEGSSYADSARRILNDIKEAEIAIQPGAEPRGRLRVSLPSAFGHRLIVPMLPAFIDRYPAIELELMFTNHRVICASAQYLEKHGIPMTPGDLQHHTCLGITSRGGLNIWEFDGPDGPQSMRIRSPIEANSTEALRRLALAGVGIIRMS
ncbi:MAG: LysR family transcriptional regulator, partial [Mesorhizobium sp.]